MLRPLLCAGIALLMIQTTSAADYYWVGDNGDWSEINHWVTTSGGTTQHNVVPGPNDRVFFDANSFSSRNQTVNVSSQSIFCLDMNWDKANNNPTFSAPLASVLNVYGSLRLNPNMVFAFRGVVNFLANTTGHSVLMAGHRFEQSVTFNGQGGGWTLASPLLGDSTLLINAGTLQTGNYDITCKRWFVTPLAPVRLELGSSRIVVQGFYATSDIFQQRDLAVVEFTRQNLTLIPGTSIIDINSSSPMVRATGSGNLSLGTVLFSNATSKGRVINESGGGLNFSKLDLRVNTDFKGPANFDTLILNKGKNFSFQSGRAYSLKKLIATGECATPIQLFSDVAGSAFTFIATMDSILGNFVSIKDASATGGAKFVLRNAVDLGNNSGWEIFGKANSALYWVGGTGNWSDPNHWSFSSGGVGGACVPTAGDNVFFDVNSGNGFTVTVDIENAYCQGMDWTGARGASFNGSSEKALHLFGSLTFTATIQQNFQGDVLFEGNNMSNVITSAGKIFYKRVTINSTGSWSLADAFYVTMEFIFTQGNLDTKGQDVFSQGFYSRNTNPRKLTLGKTHWTLQQANSPVNNGLDWNLVAENLVLDAGTSIIEFKDRSGLLIGGDIVLNQVWFNGGPGNILGAGQRIDSIKCINSIYLNSSSEVGVLEMLTPNHTIHLSINDTFSIRKILTPNLCSGMIEMRSQGPGQKTYLQNPSLFTVSRLMLQDIVYLGSGTAIANTSIDLGGNAGWNINEATGRNLYWVGKGGNSDWFDSANWSLSSGGLGGECVPTPKDNVFFDANSFNGANQGVTANPSQAYCLNMSWEGANHNPNFFFSNLNVFGSVSFPPRKDGNFCASLFLRSHQMGQTIKTQGSQIGLMNLSGKGSWILQDSLNTQFINQQEGEFNSNDQYVLTGSYVGSGEPGSQQSLKMGKSHWRIFENGANFTNTLTLDAGTSLLEFTSTNPYISVSANLSFHNVLFSNPAGASIWKTEGNANQSSPPIYTSNINRMEFRNSGIMYGQNILDSLIFTAGKSYQLDATLNQTINKYFRLLGNNCNPIELSSTTQGTKAEVMMNGGRVLADFVLMRDLRGVGSTQFLAGTNSTNIANSNEHWVFDSPVDYVDEGILGKDAVLCKNSNISLNANTFSANETYRWSDGSTTAKLNVSQGGTYSVEVSYGNGCTLKDSIRILPSADFAPDLIADTTLCAKDSLTLDADLNLVGAIYRWQDGSTASSINVTQAGQYKVTVELSGCSASDSTQIHIISPIAIKLGSDTSICSGQSLFLDASKTGGNSFLWSDGSTSAMIRVRAAGLYWVQVSDGQCTAQDSININLLPAFGLSLGRDTSFCEGASFALRSNLKSALYRWSDGSSNASLAVNTPGLYWLEAKANGCTERDSVQISILATPRFELGVDTSLCQGTSFNLQPLISLAGNPSYRWSNNSTTSTITVQTNGVYSVTVTLNGCSFNDQKRLTFNPAPSFELGANQEFCIGESYQPDVAISGAHYLWNTGATASGITVNQSGLYYVDVTLNGCTKRDSVTYTFSPEPAVNLGRDTTLCAGEALNLNAAFPNATYRWNDGSTSATRNLNSTQLAWVDVSVNGCSKTDSIRVQFIDLPKGLLGADTTLCEGQTLQLRAQISNTTLQWMDGSSAPTLMVNRAGTYWAQLGARGCQIRDSITVAYNPLPKFNLGKDTALCTGETLALNALSGPGQVTWSTGASSPGINVNTAGSFWAQVTTQNCSFRDSIRVTFFPIPQVNLGPDTLVCNDKPFVIQATGSPNAQLRWSDGSSNQALTSSNPGLFWVKASNGPCSTTDSMILSFRECIVFKAFTPNAFSPDGNNNNDSFKPFIHQNIQVTAFEFHVFDRWGNRVFHSSDINLGWDGIIRGHKAPQGLYIYWFRIQYVDDNGPGNKLVKGEVNLLR